VFSGRGTFYVYQDVYQTAISLVGLMTGLVDLLLSSASSPQSSSKPEVFALSFAVSSVLDGLLYLPCGGLAT
jgi:hypothetical protein